MSGGRSGKLWDGLVMSAPVVAGLLDLLIRYRYHWAAGETVAVAKLLSGLVLIPLALLIGHSLSRFSALSARALACAIFFLARVAGPVLFAIAVFPSATPLLDSLQALSVASQIGSAVVVLVLFVAAVGDGARSRRIRLATAVATVLFVVSEPVLAWTHSHDRVWPAVSTSPSGDARETPSVGATALLLLDETSAQVGSELARPLLDSGWTVRIKEIDAVADGTAKAVPQMFTGEDFHAARPCSFSAICSEEHVLDFGRVHASRPDIDVVGFFHPYCEMQGLRSCFVTGISMPIFDTKRWACALDRRLGSSADHRCDVNRDVDWERQKDELLAAFWAAPFWTQGGMLFAHLPLPHPPASNHTGSLAVAYQNNVNDAAQLLKETAARLARSGGAATIVVFSDHPLRTSMWCADPRYASPDCQSSAARFESQRVPLIVATMNRAPLDLSRLHNNADVFRLMERPADPAP